MSANAVSVVISLLDKDYKMACPEGEEEALLIAAKELDKRMRSIKNNNKSLSPERVAIMVSMNLTHELLSTDESQVVLKDRAEPAIDQLNKNITQLLNDNA